MKVSGDATQYLHTIAGMAEGLKIWGARGDEKLMFTQIIYLSLLHKKVGSYKAV